MVSDCAVAFGGLLLLGARACDRVRPRRIFTLGLLAYGVASLAGGLAATPGLLIAARAAQGLGGALFPATLTLISVSFAEGREHHRAFAVWGTAGGSGMILGSLLGGVLTDWFGSSSTRTVAAPGPLSRRWWHGEGEQGRGAVVADLLLSKTDAWTVEDLLSLPDDGRRYEIVDGSLVMSPYPTLRHQLIVAELCALLRAAAPAGLAVLPGANVVIRSTIRGPDVLVLAQDVARRESLTLEPVDVLLAVEVVSPTSETTDRVTKPAEYAAAGIEHFWRVEPSDGPLLVAYRRRGASYTEVGAWRAAEPAQLGDPFPVRIVPADLL